MKKRLKNQSKKMTSIHMMHCFTETIIPMTASILLAQFIQVNWHQYLQIKAIKMILQHGGKRQLNLIKEHSMYLKSLETSL